MKNNIRSVERCADSPLVQIQVNEPIKEQIFYWRGIPHIVGGKLRWNGHLFEMEMMPIKGENGFHIHQYFNGICYLCGIYKRQEMPK